MDEKEQKIQASKIIIQAMKDCEMMKIDPYITIGSFIDEIIKKLSLQNEDEKIGKFLESIADKVKSGIYRRKD
tara:strand:- start:2187 stop:2405 length:219 start_codon:yes stop_codon:yes gene_type:complete